MSALHVAIVGAGLSGTVLALHLLRHGAERVTLIERERVPGRGTAYGTSRREHLLNVTARRMSLFPDEPDHFARWFAERGGAADDYAPRMLFGDYVCELLDEAGERIETLAGDAVDVTAQNGSEQVRLADGRTIAADAVVLALGNLRPAPPPGIRPERLGDLYVADPWYGRIAEGLDEKDKVLLVGTGLTAIDATLTLDALGYKGRIVALSRRGLAPRAHLKREAVAEPRTRFPEGCADLLRAIRRRSAEIGWREAVHELRPVTQQLWGAADLEQRRRFVRHLRPWWDVHRHRIAPAVAERIDAMQRSGQLSFRAGKIVSAEADGDSAAVTWRPRGGGTAETLRVQRVVNCTGPELDIARAGEPLLDALLAAGRIRADRCRIGIDVDQKSRALDAAGEPSARLSVIGPMTRGAFWETIAVSDIAAQAEGVARRLVGSAG